METDIVVVGAGPAGGTVAREVAAAGFKVLIIDKRQELGAPVQCSGAVSRHALIQNGVEPDFEFINQPIYGFKIMDGSDGEVVIDYRKLKPDEYGTGEGRNPLGYIVDRRRFDRYLLTQAERAGATALLKAEATGFERAGNDVLVSIRHYNRQIRVRTKIIIGADGIRSQVGKWAGLKTHIKLKELASCLQFIVDGVETDGLLELITGRQTAPGGYGWIFPKGNGYTEIGLGIIAPFTPHNARWHLDSFIDNSFLSHRFKHLRLLEVQGGGVPLSAPLKQPFADNVLLVGDAARHLNPITGGGIHTALGGAMVAAGFLIRHLPSGNPHNAATLSKYNDLWLNTVGHQMWKLYDVKKKIFKEKDLVKQDARLFETMSSYFNPSSEFKKI